MPRQHTASVPTPARKPGPVSLALLAAIACAPALAAHRPTPGDQPLAREAPDQHTGCELCSQAKLQWLKSRKGTGPGPGPDQEPLGTGDPGLLGTTDVLHYDLELEILTATTQLSGRNTLRVRALAPIDSMDVELASSFAVGAVRVGPVGTSGVPVTFTRPLTSTPQVMRVSLDRPYAAGEEFDLSITYLGTPVSGGLGSIVWTTQGGFPLICTLSETRFAHTWWPVKENNSDKATADLKFIVPSSLTVASQGTLVSEEPLAGSRKRFRWVTSYPTAPYLFSFSATVYNRFFDTWTWTSPFDSQTYSTPLVNYIYPASDTTANRQQWLFNKDRLTTLSSLFGVYPFHAEKYGVYQFFFSGGMEHQTFSGQGGSGSVPFGAALSVHELAHQWFGNAVTCATWNDIWLNEGPATYAEALWGEFRPASLGANGLPELKLRMSQRRPAAVSESVYVIDASTDNEARIFSNTYSYRKGAWALHMLRRVMGDQAFFAALRDYLAAHRFATASTADLQAACEARHGASLEWFFRQWIYGAGAPTFNWSWRTTRAGAQDYVELFIEQTQSAAWPFASGPQAGTFSMPLEVVASITGLPAPQTLAVRAWNDKRRQHLLIPITIPPGGSLASASLDPDDWVLAVASATSTASAGSKTLVSFPPAPPKVVATSPAPATSVTASTAGSIIIDLHQPLDPSTLAQSVTLTRDAQQVQANATTGFAPGRVSITPPAGLRAGAWSVTLAPTLRSTAGIALDGETPTQPGWPAPQATLPSGDGVPGGPFVLSFTARPCNLADIAGPGQSPGGDFELTADDVIVFINWFSASDTRADIAGPGQTPGSDTEHTADDLILFMSRFFTPCG
jgi:hypothetical protein